MDNGTRQADAEKRPPLNGVNSYSDLDLHRRVGLLIRDRSENKRDIREVAKESVDLKNVHTILNLGCGYGWFEASLEGGFDLVAGIDLYEENRAPFLREAGRISAGSLFQRSRLPAPIDMPAHSFDLIVSIYSLYFFPEIVPEVRKLLAPNGDFLCVTHSERMLEEAEEFFRFTRLRRLIERFSAENGEAYLKKHFQTVRYVDYPNRLVFRDGDREALRDYVLFKRDFIAKDTDPDLVREKLLLELEKKGALSFNKNDRVFVAKE